MIVIVDYGMGNLCSIKNMFKKIGVEVKISCDVEDIEKADKLILPGVGSFDNGMKNLIDLGIIPVLENKVIKGRTLILGICLGMQLLTKSSEEGCLKGLGWINAQTVRFNFEGKKKYKVPHMGWNDVYINKRNFLFNGLDEDIRYYFVHSYHVVCNNEQDVLAKTNYGYDFVSALARDNILGVQFHPEKSHKYGLNLLRNFEEL